MFSSNANQASNPLYIEDVFSTYLYTGNSSTQTISNGIDLSTKGGLVLGKIRNLAGGPFQWYDTARGATKVLESSGTAAEITVATGLTSFNSNGFTIGSNSNVNLSPYLYVGWTFRKQAKFFDVVTWSGSGINTTIPHSLGVVPGCIIVKRTDTTADWAVYHRSLANTQYLVLNTTAAAATGATWWNSTTPTSAVFSVGTDASVNASGGTYVAYLFAHDAGGFGLTGADNVISCGTFTTDGSANATVNLGYEPQWILSKRINIAVQWELVDNMRGWTASTQPDPILEPNTTRVEQNDDWSTITSTGFTGPFSSASQAYIYIAIRRGPMAVPTLGTSVFIPSTYTGDGNTGRTISSLTSPVDLLIMNNRNSSTPNRIFTDRLRGSGTGENSGNMKTLTSTSTVSESDASLNGYYATLDYQNSVNLLGSSSSIYNGGSTGYVLYTFKRAPSFFDEVCYTGTGATATTQTHNLGATPEFMIIKSRNTASTSWVCYHKGVNGGVNPQNYYMLLQSNQAQVALTAMFNDTAPTSSVFTVGPQGSVGASGRTYVAYLFATCTGVSKVGSYTGTGATQTIACGFGASGARFVLIKRTDSTGDWYVWDSARGMISGTDPSLLLNDTAAEVNANSIYAISTGFQIVSTAAGINSSASGATYIFLAIA